MEENELDAGIRQETGTVPETGSVESATADTEAMTAEIRRLAGELEKVTGERDALLHRSRVRELAADSGCRMPEFLDFLASKRQVNLQDDAAAQELLQSMKQEFPGCFAATVQPGSGTVPERGENSAEREYPAAGRYGYGNRLDYIVGRLGNM